MEKQKTVVRVAGKEYALVSSDPPAYMQRVAAYVDRKLSEMAVASRLPSNMVSVLACLNMADELMKSHDENTRLRRELTALQSLIPLDRGFRIAAESSMTTVAEAVQSRLSFFHMVSGFSCFEMKRCLEGQEPAEEIRNVVQEQIRRILALGAEEGLISGGFSEEYQTMCFLGAVGSYLASLQAQLLPEPQARAYAYQMLIRSLSAASPAEAPAL